MSRLAREFTELDVYREAVRLADRVFQASQHFPREESYALSDQIRRASRAIGAQIAEAWGKRRYPRHFYSKLSDADAERREVLHWVQIAADCGYLNCDEVRAISEHLIRIGRQLTTMMRKASAFRLRQPFDS